MSSSKSPGWHRDSAYRTATATWLWRTPHAPSTVVAFARSHGLTEVFIDPASPRTVEIVTELARCDITSTCLGGDPQWTFDHDGALRWCTDNLTRAAFSGLHIDVEPWALPQWQTDRAATAKAYAELVERIATRLGPPNVDIVPWLFTIEPAVCRRVVRASQSLTLLAYRDRAARILDYTDVARAALRGRDYRIGVETQMPGAQVPADTTFGDDGAAALDRELATLGAALAADSTYRGVAVHHYGSWRALRP